MDNEKELVHFILQYLLDNHFESKSDMARQLDIRSRTMQRAFEQLHNDKAKGSTIVLDRALLFCAQRRISVDQVFQEYNDSHQTDRSAPCMSKSWEREQSFGGLLCIPEQATLSEMAQKNYSYAAHLLRCLFPFMCPHCSHWCDPQGQSNWIYNDCTMGKLARTLFDTVRESNMDG